MKVGIVGAGILGRLFALEWVKQKAKVTLFEEGNDAAKLNASFAAAGMLAPISELEKNPKEIGQLGLESLNLWPDLIKSLPPIYYSQHGSIVTAHHSNFADLKHYINIIASKIEPHYFLNLNNNELTALEPELSHLNNSYHFPIEAQMDNQALLHTLFNFLSPKIEWINAKVISIYSNEINVNNKKYVFDYVFDCRGMGAKEKFIDLRGVRGELIWLHAPAVNIKRPIRLIHPRYSLYIVPRPEHLYLLGASEIEAEDLSPISVRTTLELLTAAYSLHKGFIEARMIKTITQLRPTLKNNLPRIQISKNCIAINGLYRHGFLIAPALVAEVMCFIQKGKTARQYLSLWEEL